MKNTIKYSARLLVLIALFNFSTSFAQQFNNISFSIKQHYGFIADVSYEYANIIKRHIAPFEINIEKSANCNKYYYFLCTNTRYGLSLYYAGLGNNEVLGQLVAPMLYLNTTVYNHNKFSIGLKAGMGSAIVTKKYHRTENYHNILFSRNINFAFGFENSYTYALTNQHSLLAGIQFNHFSNGESQIPNGGMNNATVFAGYTYNLTDPSEKDRIEKFLTEPEIHLQIIPTIGRREILHEFGEKFLTSSFSVEAMCKATNLNEIGLGIATFYDEAHLQKLARQQKDTISGFSNKIVGGIYISHEFNFHPLYIVFHAGKFVGNTKLALGHEYFNRMGIRYFISKRVFLNLTHKSHFFFKGNNIEWGLGIKW